MREIIFEWAVVGAGPAGIAAIGKLLDQGIHPKKIAWIDPAFTVGDFGTRWQHVSSNTRVGLFLKFFERCQSFKYNTAPDFDIHQTNPDHTCCLALAAKPLQWITEHLKQTVHSIQDTVQHLKLYDRCWHLQLAQQTLQAKQVILATGSEPKSLAFPGVQEIPLRLALDPHQLAPICHTHDTVAVFGSSHSAVLIIKTLLEQCDVKHVMNFYLSPLRYAVYLDDWILFDDTGLKGNTATWAREHLDGKLPNKLTRVISNEENIRQYLPQCSHAIYATGFQKRLIPIEGMHSLEYNDRSGIIAPGLFGLGIAFPEAKIDRFGTLEHRVGLWKFMDYLERVLPVWMKYGC
ncbi:MAG: FAD-dependent oxidoreductase [Legionellaceae bacterium]|nr:FAD-dependent oxidoreductase [Legionellaceae bacterium]